MKKRAIFTQEAEDDVAYAYAWYEEREPGLGEEFLRCIEACIETMSRHPMPYRTAVDEFRRALSGAFPSKFSTNRMITTSWSTPYSTARKIPISGKSA